MSKSNFTEDFKRDAVRQITERGYSVAEVFQRLGVSQHSLYEWKKKFAASNAKARCCIRLNRYAIFSVIMRHHLTRLDLADLRRVCELHSLDVGRLLFANECLGCRGVAMH